METARIIKTLEWMVKTFLWQHEQAGIAGSYSPELKEAIELLQELKINAENLTIYGRNGD